MDTFIPGIKSKFNTLYSSFIDMNPDEDVGYIRIADKGTLSCDIEVLAILKSLVKLGVTNNSDLASACRDFFLSILRSHDSFITKQRALNTLSPIDYESEQLYEAISTILGGTVNAT